MNPSEQQQVIEDLQVTIAHHEVAIETLSAEVTRQAQLVVALRGDIDRLKRELRELKPSPLDGTHDDEPPPPHY